jgi:drug/metabolite transporter (DMT)-like permease
MSPDRSSPVDDADIAAGQKRNVNGSLPRKGLLPALTSTPPRSLQSNLSLASLNTNRGHPSDLEFYEDLVSEPVLVLGMDISHLSRREQFIVTAIGVFCFSLLYGYLQELISVELCNRQLGLFLAMVQFTGYTVLAFFLRNFVYHKQRSMSRAVHKDNDDSLGATGPQKQVPFRLYLGLSLLRAVDLAMTNMAMQYLNYPAKTLMKSSRIVFTMFFGVVIQRKKYHLGDYLIVLAMVAGLALFMHADANSDAIFHHMGVIMLTISLICDGAISNMSESIMKDYGVGQDEFIFRMYSIALIAIAAAAAYRGDLQEGIRWMHQPGTYAQIDHQAEERTWSILGKITVMTLFSSMGFFGSSCSAAITKNFGALTMSITSTARKATTLFLSFALFHNVCTSEHLMGIIVFISALTTKSLRRGRVKKKRTRKILQQPSQVDLESLDTPEDWPLNRRSYSSDGIEVPSLKLGIRENFGTAGRGANNSAHVV